MHIYTWDLVIEGQQIGMMLSSDKSAREVQQQVLKACSNNTLKDLVVFNKQIRYINLTDFAVRADIYSEILAQLPSQVI